MRAIMIYILLCSGYSSVAAACIESIPDKSTTIFVFCHGLGATHKQIAMYTPNVSSNDYPNTPHWIIPDSYVSFDFPDAKNDRVDYHEDKVNLGQNLDIHRLLEVCKKLHIKYPHQKMVLVGVSRGAVTILNALAIEPLPYIKAAIVESPFDTLYAVANHMLKKMFMHWIPGSKKLALKMAGAKFTTLDINGIMPLKVAKDIPKDFPIFIIHSRNDQLIPMQSARRLYVELKETDHTNIHYLEMAGGEHARLIVGPEADLYQNIVHAFYKKFNIPHHDSFAKKAESLLAYCQPDHVIIKKMIKRSKPIEELEEL